MYKIDMEKNIAIRIKIGKGKSIRLFTFPLHKNIWGMFVVDFGKIVYLNSENSVYI